MKDDDREKKVKSGLLPALSMHDFEPDSDAVDAALGKLPAETKEGFTFGPDFANMPGATGQSGVGGIPVSPGF